MAHSGYDLQLLKRNDDEHDNDNRDSIVSVHQVK